MYNRMEKLLHRHFSFSFRHLQKEVDLPKTGVVWNEVQRTHENIKNEKKKEDKKLYPSLRDELVFKLTRLGRIVKYKNDLNEYLQERRMQKILYSQKFMQERVNVLGPDLAAAHFILYRGGTIKFLGNPEWIGINEAHQYVPNKFLHGYHVEGINAYGTNLYYEGLENLYKLKNLRWLSLKGLVNINDFGLDLISGRFGPQLEYLDLSGCTGISYHGLASFYRFKCLKCLDLTGIEQSPELKLICLTLLDQLPDLQVKGVDLLMPDQREDQILIGSNMCDNTIESVKKLN